MKRLKVLALVLMMVASACAASDVGADETASTTAASGDEPTTSTSTDAESPSSSTTTSTVDLGDRSALSVFTGGTAGGEYPDTLPAPTVDTSELFRGQVPDGIPAIDDPQFVSVADADDYLAEQEAVVVLDIEGDARAYPVQILIWHEIVNDVVGGVPVSITYCPLCNSAVSYRRIVQGEVTTFGTSGLLFNSALVMYDRLTESLWTHYNGEAIAGIATSERLGSDFFPIVGMG